MKANEGPCRFVPPFSIYDKADSDSPDGAGVGRAEVSFFRLLKDLRGETGSRAQPPPILGSEKYAQALPHCPSISTP